jgi:hypothetical protein
VFAMFKKLFSVFEGNSPVIEPVEFRDGLLAFRCQRRLPFQALTVAAPTPAGPVKTEILVCSYDPTQQVYRAQLPQVAVGDTLQRLHIESRGTRRLTQALRVSSRQIPKFFALTEDISVGGLRLATEDIMRAGSILEMSLDLDDPAVPTMIVRGEVVWSALKGDGTFHSGIRFLDLERLAARRLERYIESRLETQRIVHGIN